MNVYKKAFITLVYVFALSGCGVNAQPYVSEAPGNVQQTVAIKDQPDEYTLFYEQDYPLSLYEPESGCYVGAYVLSNRDINFDITKFDDMTGKVHAVSVYNLKAGNPFPDTWVISCVAEKKTPYFILTPPNGYNPYDISMINSLAEQFGELYVPMFVEFYPVSGLPADSKAYINFFRYAREKFKEKASNVAFVWAVDAKDAVDSDVYYPGDSYVDWVGLHAIEPLSGDNYGVDLFNAIDYFYYTYQKSKPIAISQFAASHYTNEDYIYKNQIAAYEINRVYSSIANSYPRIKMINYMDFDEPISDPKKKSDCYTVTENNVVLSAYTSAVADERFLCSTAAYDPPNDIQLMRSPFPVLKIGEYWYASEYSFMYDLNTKGTLGERLIDGRKYYNINFFLKNSQKSLTVDEDTRSLVLASANTNSKIK